MLSGAFTLDMFKPGLSIPTLVPNSTVVVSSCVRQVSTLQMCWDQPSGRDSLPHALDCPLSHKSDIRQTQVRPALQASVVGTGQFAPGTYLDAKFGTPARIVTPNVKSPDCLSLFHIIDEFLVRRPGRCCLQDHSFPLGGLHCSGLMTY